MGLAWGDAVVEWGCKDGVWDKIVGFQRSLGWWDDVVVMDEESSLGFNSKRRSENGSSL